MDANILKDEKDIDERFAYNFGSVGFVRFLNRNAMFQFLSNTRSKIKPTINGKAIWISTSKTPEERTKAKHLGKFKKVPIETQLATPEQVYIDYKLGRIFIDKVRVAEWKTTEGQNKLVIDKIKGP